MKHIESILPENVADELTRFLLDDTTISSALKDLLHRDTGCVIPTLDNVPASDIEEIIPLCLIILRRFWNTPLTALGDGTEKQSIAEVFQKVIGDRMQGNEALGIPVIQGNISTAVSVLDCRHIDDGLTLTLPAADGSSAALSTSLPDGLSLAQLLCGSDVADSVTELKDENVGWTMTKALTGFPNLERLELGCKHGDGAYNIWDLLSLQKMYFPELVSINYPSSPDGYTNTGIFNNMPKMAEIGFPKLEVVSISSYGSFLSNIPLVKVLNLPSFKEWRGTWNGGIIYNMQGLEELYLPEFRYCGGGGTGRESFVLDCPLLWKVVVGYGAFDTGTFTTILARCPNVYHFEFLHEVSTSQKLTGWSPTTALSEHLPEFLSNFQTYIADRMADMTGKPALTLTLSSAVYAALEAQEGQTILATLANKNWNVAQA